MTPGTPRYCRLRPTLAALLLAAWVACRASHGAPVATAAVLDPGGFKHYVDRFNGMENENVANLIPNAKAWEWMRQNVPAFECPDKEIEEVYWYRWWTYRKHVRQFPDYVAITEFLTYKNPVSSAVGH